MELHFNPDLQAKLDKLATETGRPTGKLVEDVLAGYFNELAQRGPFQGHRTIWMPDDDSTGGGA